MYPKVGAQGCLRRDPADRNGLRDTGLCAQFCKLCAEHPDVVFLKIDW